MTKGHGSKFTRKKEAAIAALINERNHAEAAKAVGIDLSTLKRWLRVPEFLDEYRRQRWENADRGYARLQQNMPAAASVLLTIMANPQTPHSARVRAAMGVFELSKHGLDMELESRIAALERAAEESKQSR